MYFKHLLSIAAIVIAFVSVGTAQAQIQRVTDRSNYGLHYIPQGAALRVSMEDPRVGDPLGRPSQFMIIVNWYSAAADGSVRSQRVRTDTFNVFVQPGEAATKTIVERLRGGEFASVSVAVVFAADPPDPDTSPLGEHKPFSPNANLFLVNNDKGLLVPAVLVLQEVGIWFE